jgi:hypothetical protein
VTALARCLLAPVVSPHVMSAADKPITKRVSRNFQRKVRRRRAYANSTHAKRKNLRIGTYSRIEVGGHLSVHQKTNRPHRKRDDFGVVPYAVNDQAFNWLMRLARSACPRLISQFALNQ